MEQVWQRGQQFVLVPRGLVVDGDVPDLAGPGSDHRGDCADGVAGRSRCGGGIILAAGLFLFLLLLALVFALIQKFTMDFVVPIQLLRGGSCLAAWKEFWGMLAGHAGLFTLYILFQIVLGMAITIIVLIAVLVTCCIAGCLMIIPYVGTVLLLPVLVFKQSYPLYFLRQFGSDYNVFQFASPAPTITGLPSPPGT